MLDFQTLIDHAEQAAGGATDPAVDPEVVVNEAGRYLVSMHRWQFLEREPLNLQFIASQDHVDLPEDFDSVTFIEASSRLESTVVMTSLSHVQFLRSSPLDDPFHYWVAIEWVAQQSTVSRPKPQLSIYPTPGTTESGALKMGYRAGWKTLVEPDEVPNVPVSCDSLLIQLVRAFTLGYADEAKGTGSVVRRLEPIEQSAMLNRIKQQDGMRLQSLGQMQGGAITPEQQAVYRPHRSISAGNTV